MRRLVFASLIAATFAVVLAPALALAALDAEEVQKKWIRRLAGHHFTSTVHYTMEGAGDRRMTLRWDDSQKRERLLVRIEWPDEIRGQSWLMLENVDRPNEYYVYSTKRVSDPVRRLRRIHRGNPFAGADVDYLGFRVARQGYPVAKEVKPATVGERKALLLTEEATDMPFDRRDIWLDARTFVPLRGEYWFRDEKYLDVVTEEVRLVQGIETPTRIRFTIPATDEIPEKSTVWQIETIDYERPILDSYFGVPR